MGKHCLRTRKDDRNIAEIKYREPEKFCAANTSRFEGHSDKLLLWRLSFYDVCRQ